MRLAVPAILLLALSSACDKDPAGNTGALAKKPTPPEPPAVTFPTTGHPKILAQREDLAKEIEKAEKDLEAGTKPPAHLVYNWKKEVEYLITATTGAIENESLKALRDELSTLRGRQGEIDKARNDIGAAILATQRHLDEVRAGGRPPEGFTEDELKDILGERQEEARALEKQEAEIRERMKENEELLAKGNPPPRDATIHTHELEALEALKARIDALEAKLR